MTNTGDTYYQTTIAVVKGIDRKPYLKARGNLRFSLIAADKNTINSIDKI